ncbi:glycosyltransferase [Mariniflexile gromovii]|uniref:UDP-glycosyltransferase n=1 Tax=Mariniflexile gromovii TaxID=362523 RepID=A0ABS4BVA5_9FLAO|nr:UDP-glycosyltransferase [Mariniflexile gromovii]MBP0904515.1 UDP-glycosyltransferase [Mariniflexile gromovii]
MTNILVATNHLKDLGGSETFTYSLIDELKNRPNFNVEYFTFYKGLTSEKIESELDVKFMSKKRYDLILANHNTCVDHLYKNGFIIQTCHGVYPKLEQPSDKANAYVAISLEVQNHLALKGYNSVVIYNGINLKKFNCHNELNEKLTTVLSLCQSAKANEFIKKACDEMIIEFIIADKNNNPTWNISKLINKSDLVIGLGRSAYEGMACGRPVIIYDNRDYLDDFGDGYVKNILGLSLQNNCSGRYFKKNFSLAQFIEELGKYQKKDGLFFRSFAEKELDIEKNTNKYLQYWATIKKIDKKRKLSKMERIVGKKVLTVLIKIYRQIKKNVN